MPSSYHSINSPILPFLGLVFDDLANNNNCPRIKEYGLKNDLLSTPNTLRLNMNRINVFKNASVNIKNVLLQNLVSV